MTAVNKFVSTNSINRLNAHFHECEFADRPYVVIRPRRKYASVEIDLIGQTFKLTDAAVEEIKERLMPIWLLRPQSLACFGDVISHVEVAIGDAQPLAEWLYDLACVPSNRVDRRRGRP